MTVPTNARQVIGDVLAGWPLACGTVCFTYVALVRLPVQSLMDVLSCVVAVCAAPYLAVLPRRLAAASGDGYVYVVHALGVRSPTCAVTWSQVRRVIGRRTVVVFRLNWPDEPQSLPMGLVLGRRSLQPGDAARIAQHARAAGVPVTGLGDDTLTP